MSSTSRFQAQDYRLRSGAEMERAQLRAMHDRLHDSYDDDSRTGGAAVRGLAVLVTGLGLFIACAIDADIGVAILEVMTFVG